MAQPTQPADAGSSSSSITRTEPERDVESLAAAKDSSSYLFRLFDKAGVTTEVLQHTYTGKGTEEEPYLVDFLDKDPKNPMAFPDTIKWTYMMLHAMVVLAVTFVSSAYSGGVSSIIQDFKIDTIISILGVSLFVLGFAIGPLLWAPLSEIYGRQILFIITCSALTVFNAGAAGAQNIETLLILRFFAGTFGSSPLTNSGGVIADMFSAKQRGLATSIFAAAPFLGPAIGPIAGGFLGETAGWRWVEGLMAVFVGIMLILITFVVPETYAPVLLSERAKKLSAVTGKKYISKLEAGRPAKSVAETFKVALTRPWALLFREPIVILLSIYMAVVYGTLYMMFAAFPIVFQQGRGWSPGIGGLAFLGVAVGMMVAVAYTMYDNKRYSRISDEHNGMAPPEARLPPGLVGAVLLPVGLFWFAWTNGPEMHWIICIVASGFFAAGLVFIFLSLLNYLIDTYVIYAASALAANTVIRSLFGAAFPLFTGKMYANLGIHWASSIPAFLALACLPFPFLFYKYGESIRLKCKYALEAAEFLDQFRQPVEDVEEEEQTEGDDGAGDRESRHQGENQTEEDGDDTESDKNEEEEREKQLEKIKTQKSYKSYKSHKSVNGEVARDMEPMSSLMAEKGM